MLALSIHRVAVAIALASISLAQGTTTRVSVSSAGNQAAAYDAPCAISGDGRWVAFVGQDPALVAGLPNVIQRAFLHDRQTGITSVVAERDDGYIGLNTSGEPTLSPDGTHVAFRYDGGDLLSTDVNGRFDIYVRDLSTGAVEQVSISSTGQQANDSCYRPSISAGGRFVFFESGATNLVPGDSSNYDIFVKDRQTAVLSCVSLTSSGGFANGSSQEPSCSADGQVVVFVSHATNLAAQVAGPPPYILVNDRVTGVSTFAVVSNLGLTPNGFSDAPSISGNGRFIAYSSSASNLVVNDTNGARDVFLFDRVTASTSRVSLGNGNVQANSDCERPSVSYDGNAIAFVSFASNLVSGDTWVLRDVFVRSRSQSLTTRVSVSSAGAQANNSSTYAALASNGQHVAFMSQAGNLVPNDTNGNHDCFVHSIGCATPESYCTPGTTTGGCTPFMSSAGTASLTAGTGFDISVNQLDGGRFGLIYYGFTPTAVSWAIGSTSLTCVAPPVQRTPIVDGGGTPGSCTGVITLDFNAFIAANPNALGAPYSAGQVFHAQGWFRDPGAPKQTNLSDGLRFTLCE